jgi:uncharacterized membrane protein
MQVSRRRNGRGFHRFLSDLHADAQLAAALEAAVSLYILYIISSYFLKNI